MCIYIYILPNFNEGFGRVPSVENKFDAIWFTATPKKNSVLECFCVRKFIYVAGNMQKNWKKAKNSWIWKSHTAEFKPLRGSNLGVAN